VISFKGTSQNIDQLIKQNKSILKTTRCLIMKFVWVTTVLFTLSFLANSQADPYENTRVLKGKKSNKVSKSSKSLKEKKEKKSKSSKVPKAKKEKKSKTLKMLRKLIEPDTELIDEDGLGHGTIRVLKSKKSNKVSKSSKSLKKKKEKKSKSSKVPKAKKEKKSKGTKMLRTLMEPDVE